MLQKRVVLPMAGAIVLIVFALRTAAAESESRAWEGAKRLASESVYGAFLQAHPAGRHAEEARVALDALLWRDATSRGTPFAYLVFVERARRWNLPDTAIARGEARLLRTEGVRALDDSAVVSLYDTLRRAVGPSGVGYEALATTCIRRTADAVNMSYGPRVLETRAETVGPDEKDATGVLFLADSVLVAHGSTFSSLVSGEDRIVYFALVGPTTSVAAEPIGFWMVEVYRDALGTRRDVYAVLKGRWYQVPWGT
jgi:hypothetical protein